MYITAIYEFIWRPCPQLQRALLLLYTTHPNMMRWGTSPKLILRGTFIPVLTFRTPGHSRQSEESGEKRGQYVRTIRTGEEEGERRLRGGGWGWSRRRRLTWWIHIYLAYLPPSILIPPSTLSPKSHLSLIHLNCYRLILTTCSNYLKLFKSI